MIARVSTRIAGPVLVRVRETFAPYAVFWAANRPYWKPQVVISLIAIVSSISYLLVPWVTKYFFDAALAGRSWHSLFIAVACSAAIHVVSMVVPFFESIGFSVTGVRAYQRLQMRVFRVLCRLPISRLRRYSTGDLLHYVTSDVSPVSHLNSQRAAVLLVGAFHLAVLVPSVVLLSWQLSCVHFPLLIMSFVVSSVFARRGAYLGSIGIARNNATVSAICEHITNRPAFDSASANKVAFRRFREVTGQSAEFDRVSTLEGQYATQLQGALTAIGALATWTLGAWLFFRGQITVGAIIGFQSALPMITENARRMWAPFVGIRQVRPSADRLNGLLAQERSDQRGRIAKQSFDSHLTLQAVSFQYGPGQPLFNHLSLTVNRGECIRILGANGTGKTTLLDLITGAAIPDSGSICLDELDIREISSVSMRQLVSKVPQEVMLLSGTIRDNLAMCCDCDSPGVQDIFERVGALALVESLPNGWDTRVGEGGFGLSGGQRQLLALARVLVRNTPILLLDEPCSSLDNSTCRKVEAYLHELRESGVTIVCTTHDVTVFPNEKTVVLMRPEPGTSTIPLPEKAIPLTWERHDA